MQGTTAPATDELTAAGQELHVAIVLDPATAALLDASRLNFPATDIRVHGGSIASFAANGPLVRWCDVLIAEVNPDNLREFEDFERFAHDQQDSIPVVAAVRELSVAVTRRVLRSAAVDVLPIPFSPDELHQAIETGRDRIAARPARPPSRGGRIIAFAGALGGVGTTALLTQLGLAWGTKQNVCIIDLDVQFGNAALYLNLRTQLSIADLVEAGERLDAEFVRSVAVRHPTGVDVIACPPDLMPLDDVTPDFVDRLLDLAVEAYDVVLIDLPTAWVSWSLSALQKSDIVCLVTGLSVPGIHQAKRQLELLEANGLGERSRVIVNRVVNPLFGKIDLSETEKLLRRRIHFAISNDFPTVSAAIDEGRPLSAVKIKSRVEKDIRALADELAIQIKASAPA